MVDHQQIYQLKAAARERQTKQSDRLRAEERQATENVSSYYTKLILKL